MNTKTTVQYDGVTYPCRQFKELNNREYLICPDSLASAIFDDEKGWFRDNHALDINDKILYTVPDNMIGEDFKTLMMYIVNDTEAEA